MGGVPDLRNGERTSAKRELPIADVGTNRRIETIESTFSAMSRIIAGMQHLLGSTSPVAKD
jgi:hypothetical protein